AWQGQESRTLCPKQPGRRGWQLAPRMSFTLHVASRDLTADPAPPVGEEPSIERLAARSLVERRQLLAVGGPGRATSLAHAGVCATPTPVGESEVRYGGLRLTQLAPEPMASLRRTSSSGRRGVLGPCIRGYPTRSTVCTILPAAVSASSRRSRGISVSCVNGV